MRSVALALVVAAAAVVAVTALDDRPIIGILTLPCDEDCNGATEYFPASYVKSVEGGGARVVPIHYTASAADITALLANLNGALFTGGGASLDDGSAYFDAVKTVYNYVVQANANGDFFPLWGTCLGFESICRAASLDPNILTGFDAENYTIPLQFTSAAASSRVFDSSAYPNAPYVMELLSTRNVTMNNHVEGVTPADFAANAKLSGAFDVLATDVDRNGRPFVALIEAKAMPIYGAQFHAEKPQYEWYPAEVIQHTHSAIAANSYFMAFFVDQTRHSQHAFPPNADIDFIYKYSPVWTNGEFTQCYFW